MIFLILSLLSLYFYYVGFYWLLIASLCGLGTWLFVKSKRKISKPKPKKPKQEVTLKKQPLYYVGRHHTADYYLINDRAYFDKLFKSKTFTKSVINHNTRSLVFYRDTVGKYQRPVAGYVLMTKDRLKQHNQSIRAGQYKRDYEKRKKAYVAGFWQVRDVNKKTHRYHRTHGLPFRYCLDDGDLWFNLFTGTATLNTGDNPDIGYKVSESERQTRVQELYNLVRKSPKGLFVKNPTIKGFPVSLDDLERLSDYVINTHPGHVFKYGFECGYKENTLIPKQVTVTLKNLTKKQEVFSITLPNR